MSIDRKKFIHQLTCITRQITCMSDSEFQTSLKNGVMIFDHFSWQENEKIRTEISMIKHKTENDNGE